MGWAGTLSEVNAHTGAELGFICLDKQYLMQGNENKGDGTSNVPNR